MARQWKKQASVAYGFALTRLALNSVMYFEEQEQEGRGDVPDGSEMEQRQQELDGILRGLIKDCLDGSTALEPVSRFRARIRREMECVVAYTDGFHIYDHALKRMARRFDEELPRLEMSDEDFVAQVMGFLTTSGDGATMNRRIQQVIGCLPIRFTRQKYYGMVQEALSAYVGSDQESIENVMYLLRTGSMTELNREQRALYPKLDELLKKLEQIRFKDLTAEDYREAAQTVELAGQTLYALSEYLETVQEIANDLYLIALTKDAAMRDTFREDSALRILERAMKPGDGDLFEELEDQLHVLEGVQEEYYEKYQRLDPAPDDPDEEARRMRCVDLLMSTSPFVSLDKADEDMARPVGREQVNKAADQFIASAEQLFSGCQKPVMRAVMAVTLSVLPICFNSIDEIRSYLSNSLGACSDFAEKEACRTEIRELMESEDYEVV